MQTGLTEVQVLESRKKYGSNVLTPPKKESIWKKLLVKFSEPLIVILLVAFAFSMAIALYEFIVGVNGLGVFLEPTGIFVAILLATVIGFLFELNAEKKFDALNQINDDVQVKVVRNGKVSQIAKWEIVVGDIVIFETGEEIHADGTLLEAILLQINESSLTGEPIISKTTDEKYFDTEATYPSNRVMKGTMVVDGYGKMVVTAVGDATEYGKVYLGAQIENNVETPLNRQLKKLAKTISVAAYCVAGLIILGRTISYFAGLQAVGLQSGLQSGPQDFLDFGIYLLHTIMIAVAIIVVAVPEGLPMSITLSLALSMKKMLQTNNLVRKMHACETMGAATVICTDKTGTLTQNRMTVYKVISYNVDKEQLYEAIAVNTTAYLDDARVLGNPTEGALLLWLRSLGVDYLELRQNAPIIEQIPFSTERKMMETTVQSVVSGRKVRYIKGAPEVVMAQCSSEVVMAQCSSEVREQLLRWQQRAMRTLCLAMQEDDSEPVLMAIVAISDPVREDVPQAIKQCMEAGVDVKIVTGDTKATAVEIGRQTGLWRDDEPNENHLTGTEFEALTDEALLQRVRSLKILSRARPMDKQRLVQLLQKKDEVVAVTGDGTNDAPALNMAQVGLSMGDGTAVAKEASDITILDNSFASITRAIMWGRSLYRNIQRFLLFQLTINVVACFVVMTSAFVGTDLPLTVTQMLWVNLIMDTLAALALASLPPTMEVMKDKPRKTNESILSRKMLRNILGTGIFLLVLLGGLFQYLKCTDTTSLLEFNIDTSNTLTRYELSIFFTFFVFLQFWNLFNAKAFLSGKSAFRVLHKSKSFLLVLLLVLAGQFLIVSFGGEMFQVVPLAAADWLLLFAGSSIVLWLGEVLRLLVVFFRKFAKCK
ncbi:MAG: calcium-translocating P-type ATPase, PMCA-type [Bacteroidales bacterium]|jgi:Ca2+-transporting ATPase|nr:calcium-translocating P-type ATPase, PMCA-type [Bacteroidales bacterium]